MQPSIPEEIRVFIVNSLAAFDTPKQVADAVKAEFDVVVSRQAVEAHDPNKRAGSKLAEKWRVMFADSRDKFINDATAIPIAHRSTRLRALHRMATKAEAASNMALAAQLHKQAAEEMGDAYTNRRNVDVRSGDGSMSPKGITDFYAMSHHEKTD